MHDVAIFGDYIGLNVKLQQLLNIFTAINCKPAFVYNIVLWFLPCLFMAELLYSKIKGTKVEWVIDVLCIVVCYVAVNSSNGLPWCLGEAAVAVPLLSLGNRFYQPLMKVFEGKNNACSGNRGSLLIGFYPFVSITESSHGYGS